MARLTHLLDHPARGREAYAVVAALLTAAAMVEAEYGAAGATLDAVEVGGAVLIGLAVLSAAWSPLTSVALMAGALAAPVLVTDDLPGFGGVHLIASMLVVGGAAHHLATRAGLAAYGVSVVVPALSIVTQGEEPYEFLFYSLVLAPAWAVGSLLRRERRRSAELQRLAAELQVEREHKEQVAVEAERTRISRELHDAVAHNVSVMTLQVGVVRRRLEARPDLTTEAETLTQAEEQGRQAVDELRRIVGLVRRGEDAALAPLPSLARLADLVEPVRATGVRVDVTVTGDVTSVPHAVDICAFRILQEAVTNCLRHAPGSPVAVAVVVGAAEVTVAIRDRGPAEPPVTAHRDGGGGGHGLVNMRERAAACGGTLTAGPDGRGYVVSATLPTRLAAATAVRERVEA